MQITSKYNKYFQLVHSNTKINDERYLEFRKRWDYYSRTLELSPKPLHVDIELTNYCNLMCPMCERNKMTRQLGYMDYKVFCSIIDQCAQFDICSVKLNLWGESLLHDDLFRMIEYARKRNIYTQFNTNLTLLTEEMIKKLILSGLHRITLSVESVIKDIYEKTRKGSNFEDAIVNLCNFIKLKPLGQEPLITLQIIRMKRNFKYIPDFIEKFKERVDYISVTNISSVSGDPLILEESMIDYTSLPKVPCRELWQRLSVHWNGNVTTCCADFDGLLTLGNVQNKTLMALWHSGELNKLRQRHKKLDFEELPCEACTGNYKL